ncbi:hypothetical protein DPMN_152789 [Dreissena polymorpha]|uniref:Uncharacterized protein n=1 Tax=Dreissena polymorpha TaxID=45954 RepID=A0A9D4FL17_DREPO|nr:hypothetical protein DPMN_152789 [Dreissena polymorpha]
MFERRLMQCMRAAETPQPRYGSGSKNIERRCYICGSKYRLRRTCPDNGLAFRDEEKTTSEEPSVSDSNGTMRERPSLKPTLKPSFRPSLTPSSDAGATMVDVHVSRLSHVECCCPMPKQIKKLGIVVDRLDRRLDELMRKFGSSSPVYRHTRDERVKDQRFYLCGSQKCMKRQCPNCPRRTHGQKMSRLTKPVELHKDRANTVGSIRVLSGRQMVPNLVHQHRRNGSEEKDRLKEPYQKAV